MAASRLLPFPLLSPPTTSTRTFLPPALSTSLPHPLLLRSLSFPRRRPSRVLSSILPLSNPEWSSGEKKINWSPSVVKAFALGEREACKLKYPNTGTEALLMGILVEGINVASRFLRGNGIMLFKVRDETVKFLGKGEFFYTSPDYPPLTDQAQRALDWAVAEKLKSGESGEVTSSHLLLGIWAQEDSAGHKILASVGFDNEKAAELAKMASKDVELNYR